MTMPPLRYGVVGIGSKALHTSRRVLLRDAADLGPASLQEIGLAAGEELYAQFTTWLPEYAGVADPAELDAAALGEVLAAFFQMLGWGRLVLGHVGSIGLDLTADDWAEAEPAAGVTYPSCFFSAGLLADFLTRLAATPASTLEIECRSRGDARCRFLVGSPETMEAAYAAIAAGQDYTTVFQP